ncbi:TEL2, telomere maintenance protein 2 [Physocladia obscura]|uniref:TEL2, telomere maintenance protein 2 n=1 Tax=Physocladia obscura TaxID=109957 RepID=A0AAD5T4D7_9FUNG|nr:TEL2, telomere maintenance protein 2 [Physocladia obscura]
MIHVATAKTETVRFNIDTAIANLVQLHQADKSGAGVETPLLLDIQSILDSAESSSAANNHHNTDAGIASDSSGDRMRSRLCYALLAFSSQAADPNSLHNKLLLRKDLALAAFHAASALTPSHESISVVKQLLLRHSFEVWCDAVSANSQKRSQFITVLSLFEAFAAMLLSKLSRLNHYHEFAEILVDLLIKLSHHEVRIHFDLFEKISSSPYESNFGFVKPIVPLHILNELVSLWATPAYAAKSIETDCFNLTSVILIAMGYVELQPVDSNVGGSITLEMDKFETRFMQGMRIYLASTSVQKRTYGMVLGECLMKKLRPASLLNFELNDDDQVIFLRSLVVKPAEENYQLLHTKKSAKPSKTSNSVMPEKAKATREPANRKRDSHKYEESDEDDENDGEDDLKPLPQSESRINAKKPLYLRDCMKNLRSEQPDVIESSLQSLPELIAKANISDLTDAFETLIQQLLRLQNTFEWDDFDLFVQESIVTLGLRLPHLTAKSLNTSLVENEQPLMKRLNILRYISFIVTVGTKRGVLIQQGTMDIVKKKFLEEKEYYFVHFATIRNLLHEIEDVSYHAIIDTCLKTLSLILKCSENSVHCIRMAREVLPVILGIKYSIQDANTRDSLLVAINIVFSVVPPVLRHDELGSDSMQLVNRFLEQVYETENDEERRAKALYLAQKLE